MKKLFIGIAVAVSSLLSIAGLLVIYFAFIYDWSPNVLAKLQEALEKSSHKKVRIEGFSLDRACGLCLDASSISFLDPIDSLETFKCEKFKGRMTWAVLFKPHQEIEFECQRIALRSHTQGAASPGAPDDKSGLENAPLQFKIAISQVLEPTLTLRAHEIDLSDLTGRSQFNARGELKLTVKPSEGQSGLAFDEKTTGDMKFDFSEAQWSALEPLKDLEKRLTDIALIFGKKMHPLIDTKLESVRGELEVQNQKFLLKLIQMKIKNSPAQLELEGAVGFDRQAALKGKVLLPSKDLQGVNRSADGRAAIPFEIHGDIKQPILAVEAGSEILTQALKSEKTKAAIQKGLNELKVKMKDPKVKEFLKKIGF